ncbi:fructokinase [Paenibacillus baekrokdamisoli]|uniref:Fructokinase n=1 Tax=Paenibacillus baekrokdamisoli TaxID=1712516 RepID=A0A3G9J9J3_9BACL|nr:sugar kinase [Paenibacillus baekrokdamisoli]MBB3072480.1 fructokinase [Paenibacillus baekrokdamisoli]BBH20538.1 fructokinase [Paenibacillus baekrokdamisoli]
MFEFKDNIPFREKKNDILTVGELLIDMMTTEYDNNDECNTYRKLFGGSPSNIALNVKKLGVNPIIVSTVGEDGLGRFLINQLKHADIDTDHIQRADESTSMVVVTKSVSTPIPIFYRGADYQISYTPKLEDSLINSKIVHFSCWPISRVPSRYTIERVIDTARNHDVLIGFDPNYHPMIWQKGENGIEYVKSIIGKVDIVKPSEDDAERLFGKAVPERYLDNFLELGARLVILTLGKDGAIVSNGRETITFNSLATQVEDTTGAGDAFWSGFYAAIVKGYSLKHALSLGFAVSAYKLKYTGAIVNLPNLEDIKEKYGL